MLGDCNKLSVRHLGFYAKRSGITMDGKVQNENLGKVLQELETTSNVESYGCTVMSKEIKMAKVEEFG